MAEDKEANRDGNRRDLKGTVGVEQEMGQWGVQKYTNIAVQKYRNVVDANQIQEVNTMISTMWVKTRTITRSSRCWAIGVLAITSRYEWRNCEKIRPKQEIERGN